MIDLNKVHELIGGAGRILLTTHENPDGDGLGCLSAMYDYLLSIKKECRILCPSELPTEFEFLVHADAIRQYNPVSDVSWVSRADLVVVFDVGDFNRLRVLGNAIREHSIPTVNIDHHLHVNENLFTYNLVDLQTAATGEILFDFFKPVVGDRLPFAIAEGLYTAVMTDTGSFRYSNTNIRSHEIAVECIRAGVQPHKIYQLVYESRSVGKMKLLGSILNSLKFECNGQLAWFSIDHRMLAEAAASPSDVDGFTDFIRSIKGVEVALMMFQNGSDTCRINFRSKGKYQIHGVATRMGGGGHPFAAGAVINGQLATVVPQVVSATIATINQQDGRE
ncbi:MAG: bifunctional oligoribonuclease/PAP phosphatase NrnA [Candidatus Neomarinimicrobiota bacterium]